MAETAQPESLPVPLGEPGRNRTIDRVAAFRFTYLAIFGFLVLYVFTLKVTEAFLRADFSERAGAAVHVDPSEGPVVAQIQHRLDQVVNESRWVRLGGVSVTVIALGADGSTLYLGRPIAPELPELDPNASIEEARRVLPASAELLSLSVPHGSLLANAILVGYAALLVQLLFVRSRALARREEERLRAATEARETARQRAGEIEGEIEAVRQQLASLQPKREEDAEEIRGLQRERAELHAQLERLGRREVELRQRSQEAQRLDEERRALEELLDESMADVARKEEEIHSLEARLKKASRAAPAGRGRESDQLGRRLRTLYKNLEIDDRALTDLVGLGDEAMKLKAEEALKRLSDEADNTLVRRKVGGLPPHLSIFELGYAGKGRIYFTRGRQRRFRVLLVGAKNSQKPDLEYLSRLPKE
jgi:hypothetical protein